MEDKHEGEFVSDGPVSQSQLLLPASDESNERLRLIQFPRAKCMPSLSPLALKMETWLRLADIPYKNVSNKFRRYSHRKHKIPYIELDGEELEDTNLIIFQLSKVYDKARAIDYSLDSDQRALSTAILALIEDKLCWVLEYGRAQDAEWFLSDVAFGGHFPRPWQHRLVRALFLPALRKKLSTACHRQGIGRLTPLEVEKQAKADLSALSTFLGRQKYFFGATPSTVDCSAFGLLCQFVHGPVWPAPIKHHLEHECKNLVKFVARMREAYWPDWDEACDRLSLGTEWKKAKIIAERYSLVPCDVSSSNLAAQSNGGGGGAQHPSDV